MLTSCSETSNVWVSRSSALEHGQAVLVGPNGHTYVAGLPLYSPNPRSLLEYNTDGSLVWTEPLPESLDWRARGTVKFDALGNLLIAGTRPMSTAETNAIEFVVAKYRPTVNSGFPAIGSLPRRTEVPLGADAALSLEGKDAAPFNVQWYFNNKPIADATNSTLVIRNFQRSLVGEYSAQAINPAGAVLTAASLLVVSNSSPRRSFNVPWRPIDPVFSFLGDGETNYIIQRSANLIDWTDYVVSPISFEPFQFWSDVWQKPVGFFRAVKKHPSGIP